MIVNCKLMIVRPARSFTDIVDRQTVIAFPHCFNDNRECLVP